MWSDPAVIVSLVVVFVSWLSSIGALLWKMGSGNQVILGRFDKVDVRLEGVEKEISIGRESRQNLHQRVDAAQKQAADEIKAVELKVAFIEGKKTSQ